MMQLSRIRQHLTRKTSSVIRSLIINRYCSTRIHPISNHVSPSTPTHSNRHEVQPMKWPQSHISLNKEIVNCVNVHDLIYLMTHQVDNVDGHLSHMNHVNMSTCFHRLAKLGISSWSNVPERVRLAVLQRMNQCMKEFEARHFPNILWAFSRMHESIFVGETGDEEALLESVLAHAELALSKDRVQPQFLSNMLWSLAYMNRKPKSLLKCISSTMLNMLMTPQGAFVFRSQEVSNSCWALGRLDAGSTELFDQLSNAVENVMVKETVTTQAIANIMLGFATSPVASDASRRRVFDLCANASSNRLQFFSEQGLANIAWSMGITKLCLPAYFGEIMTNFQSRNPTPHLSHWIVIMWAMNRCQFHREEFFLQFAQLCAPQVNTLTDRELQSCMDLFRKSGVHSPGLIAAIIKDAEIRNLPLFSQ